MELTAQEEERKAAWIKARGYWKPWTEALLRLNPEFLDSYAIYGGYTARRGPLSPLMIELIYIALDGSSTHLYSAGLKTHFMIALKLGATPAQLMEVLQLGVAQGLDGTHLGVRILVEELQAAGQPIPELATALSEKQLGLKREYEEFFLDWPNQAESLLRLDAGFFEVMLGLVKCGIPGERLDPPSRTLIMLALNACFTELDADGVRVHIRRALQLGIGKDYILQVLQLVAHIGIHACSVGAVALTETLKEEGVALPAAK